MTRSNYGLASILQFAIQGLEEPGDLLPGDQPFNGEIDVTNMSSTHYEFMNTKTGKVRTGDLIKRPAIPKGNEE